MEFMGPFKDRLEVANRLIGEADFRSALRLLHGVLEDAEARGDDYATAVILNRLGRAYRGLGNPALSIQYHMKALDIFQRMEDHRGLADTYNSLGVAWSRGGDRAETVKFRLKGLEAAQHSGDLRELSRAYNNVGEIYREEGRCAEAQEHYLRSMEFDRQAGNKAYEAVGLHNLALLAMAEGDIPEARRFFRESLVLSAEARDKEMEAETLVRWGTLEMQAHRWHEAEDCLKRGLALAETLQSSQLLGVALGEMAAYHRARGNYLEALGALERLTEISREEYRNIQASRLLAVPVEMEVERSREKSQELAHENKALRELIAEQVREIDLDKEEALNLRDRAQKTLEDSLLALASVIEAKDPHTGGHGARVAGYARALARSLGLFPGDRQRIYLGAIVHDVGKIGVPDAILGKPNSLERWEQETFQRHPTMGHQILSRIQGLDAAAEVALCHHERWDGKGYPRGLKGTDIPIFARIVAIANVWDNLVSSRPHRSVLTREEARRAMTAERGGAFDPDLLDLFLDEKEGISLLYRPW